MTINNITLLYAVLKYKLMGPRIKQYKCTQNRICWALDGPICDNVENILQPIELIISEIL